MKRNDEVYNIICQSGPSRVLTVAPLQLCPPDIKGEIAQDDVDKHESKQIKITNSKSDKPCEVIHKTHLKPLPKYVIVPDTVVLPKAYAVIPSVLQYKSNEILARKPLPEYVTFGPVQGVMKIVSSQEVKDLVETHAREIKPIYLLSIKNGSRGASMHIDVSDPEKSNWISLLPLGSQTTANVWLYKQENNLYAVTTKSIATREPLKVGYSSEYAEAHGIPASQPICDLREEFNKAFHRCIECSTTANSSEELKRHKLFYHTVKVPDKYRCKYCYKKFARRYTLKMHIALKCTKKAKTNEETPPDDSNVNPVLADSIANITQPNTTEDEQRLPSDESLQNFSSILDFSTNLFDTDRISNLDISVTRSDNDFSLMNDFDFDEALVDSVDSPEKEQVKNNSTIINKTSSPYTCAYCKQIVLKSKLRQHAKVCTKRRFHCQMCRKFFRSKETLALHVFNVHKENESAEQSSEKPEDIMPYKCSHCQLAFKRRGMLVNHMSRSHGATAARLPLLVRDRRYPCPKCPKLYSTAAKRDIHMAAHHPGVEYNRLHAIELGQRVKQASSCWLCPRQYATKAKLMQHIRQRHPGAAEEKVATELELAGVTAFRKDA